MSGDGPGEYKEGFEEYSPAPYLHHCAYGSNTGQDDGNENIAKGRCLRRFSGKAAPQIFAGERTSPVTTKKLRW